MISPDPKSPEQAKQERRVPLAQNDNRFRPLLADWLDNDWFFQMRDEIEEKRL